MSRRGDGTSGVSSNAAAAQRQNEYFVPRDGIDREVITADICRYLGRDALVRPGTYPDPETGRNIQGYYITAYRNLTSAMIQDLKADSARWDQERRSHTGNGGTLSSRDPSDVLLRSKASDTLAASYGSRYTGPSQYPGSDAPGYSASQGAQQYEQPSPYDARQTAYANSSYAPGQQGFQQAADPRSYVQSPSMYSNPRQPNYQAQTYQESNPPYLHGANFVERVTDPTSGRAYTNAPSQDPRYYQGQSQPSYAQPVDPFGGRGNPGFAGGPPADYTSSTPQPGTSYQYVPETPTMYDGPSSTPPPRAGPSSSSQAQTGNSSSSHSRREHREHREHRDRDSYSKSDRHSRRPPPAQ